MMWKSAAAWLVVALSVVADAFVLNSPSLAVVGSARKQLQLSAVKTQKQQATDDNNKSLEAPQKFKLPAGIAAVALAVAFSPAASFAVSGGGLDYAGIDISGQDFSNGNYKGKDFTQGMLYLKRFALRDREACVRSSSSRFF